MSVIFAFVVMADAAGVRRASGKQAEVLNKLVNSSQHVRLEKNLKELLGHTPVQVFAGAALGALMAILFA
jgi:acid phosphatase family membrane protein YuiD